jgi:tetratricopeptide (TPR) repeat protein
VDSQSQPSDSPSGDPLEPTPPRSMEPSGSPIPPQAAGSHQPPAGDPGSLNRSSDAPPVASNLVRSDSAPATPSSPDAAAVGPGGSPPTASNGEPPASESEGQSPDDTEGTPEDDLPEWEPLTPELVEDEAIRGDFVLRWAVVGLALLVGLSPIADMRTLVHARSGQYLIEHGLLPPAHDPFSLTASERIWVNLSWGFDLITAALYRLTGAVGLSVIQAVVLVITFGLLNHISRRGIRTWWGSICAAAALWTCLPQVAWLPTLVGWFAVVLLLFVHLDPARRQQSGWIWASIAVCWAWAQCDPRAWLGPVILGLLAVGEQLDRWRTAANDVPPTARPVRWWLPAAAAAVFLVHPFTYRTWLAPWTLYAVEYPAYRQAFPRAARLDTQWYPLWTLGQWSDRDVSLWTGIALAVAACLCLWLNRKRVAWGHLLLCGLAMLLAVMARHELAVTGLIWCALATLNAQDWFWHRFGQRYSIAPRDLLFSRGGRAVTVISLFAMAWLAISGRIDGPDGRRTGIGLDPAVALELQSLSQLNGTALDARAFHFTVRQGDAAIAAGGQSFVDSRVGLFAGTGEDNLLALHDRVRTSLRQTRPDLPGSGDRTVWQPVFDRYELSQLRPRLTATTAAPDYLTLFDVLLSPEWSLTKLTPATAAIYRKLGAHPGLPEYLANNSFDVFADAFRTATPRVDEPRPWLSTPTFSERLLSVSRRQMGGSTLLAEHYCRLAEGVPGAPATFRLACLMQACRIAEDGVKETPRIAAAYRVWGESLLLLGRVEAAVLDESNIDWSRSTRTAQAAAALRQAVTLKPDDLASWSMLFQLYQSLRRLDLGLAAAERMAELDPLPEVPSDADFRRRDSLLDTINQLRESVGKVQEQINADLAAGKDRLAIAADAVQAGCPKLARDVLEADAVAVERQPIARLLLTQCLLDEGLVEVAEESAARLSVVGPATGLTGWQDAVARVALTRGDYLAAIDSWNEVVQQGSLSQLQALMVTLPMATSSPIFLGDVPYPLAHLSASGPPGEEQRTQAAIAQFAIALCELQRANLPAAKTALDRLLTRSPATPLRPLARIYWFALTDTLLDPEPPQDQIPITPDLFAPDDPAPPQQPDPAPPQQPDPAPQQQSEAASPDIPSGMSWSPVTSDRDGIARTETPESSSLLVPPSWSARSVIRRSGVSPAACAAITANNGRGRDREVPVPTPDLLGTSAQSTSRSSPDSESRSTSNSDRTGVRSTLIAPITSAWLTMMNA